MTSRKQTQIAEREAEILKIAAEILNREGPAALTMERVLEGLTFSKGTLYNHFSSSDDWKAALKTQCFLDHLAYFERGARFQGRPRERLLAVGQGHEIKNKIDPQPIEFVLTETILKHASERWRKAFFEAHRKTMAVFIGIVQDAIASGDLDGRWSPEFVASSAWSLSVGSTDLHQGGLIFREMPEEAFNRQKHIMFFVLLDGFGWKPLSSEHDYEETRRRVREEIYGPEAEKLRLIGPGPEREQAP